MVLEAHALPKLYSSHTFLWLSYGNLLSRTETLPKLRTDELELATSNFLDNLTTNFSKTQ